MRAKKISIKVHKLCFSSLIIAVSRIIQNAIDTMLTNDPQLDENRQPSTRSRPPSRRQVSKPTQQQHEAPTSTSPIRQLDRQDGQSNEIEQLTEKVAELQQQLRRKTDEIERRSAENQDVRREMGKMWHAIAKLKQKIAMQERELPPIHELRDLEDAIKENQALKAQLDSLSAQRAVDHQELGEKLFKVRKHESELDEIVEVQKNRIRRLKLSLKWTKTSFKRYWHEKEKFIHQQQTEIEELQAQMTKKPSAIKAFFKALIPCAF